MNGALHRTAGRFNPLRLLAALTRFAAAAPAIAQVQGCVNCAKVAVLNMDSVRGCQSFSGEWGGVINCNYGWQSFQAMLESSMTQTRKLQIVERQQLYNVFNEQALQSYFKSAGRRWDYGVSPANYLVYGNITEIGFENREYRDSGSSNRNLVGTFAVDVKLAETRTGKIFYAASIRVEETMAGSSSSTSSSSSRTASLGALYGALQRKAAVAIARMVTTQIFPIKVLRATGNSAILSYGSPMLESGMMLELTDGTGTLVDPDTGRMIAGAGVPVTTLQVTSANADYAVATLRSGSASALVTVARVNVGDGSAAVAAGPTAGGAWPER